MRKLISICIPTYEMRGLGAGFLRHSFSILTKQTFKDFDIIVSDHSITDEIKSVCDEFKGRLDIKYFKNDYKRGNSPANTNFALRQSTGIISKILFQDDYLASPDSLEKIAKAFDTKRDTWLISACAHSDDGVTTYRPFYPRYNDKIELGKNTISSPSVLAISNKEPLMFDENLIWSMDCDYYKRCYETFGEPKILNEICVINRVGAHQISATETSFEKKDSEHRYILEKYGYRFIRMRMMWRKAKRNARNLIKKAFR